MHYVNEFLAICAICGGPWAPFSKKKHYLTTSSEIFGVVIILICCDFVAGSICLEALHNVFCFCFCVLAMQLFSIV